MEDRTLNQELIVNIANQFFPEKKPLLMSQGYTLENLFVVRYQYPAHEIPEHLVPYTILEVIEDGNSIPHKRRLVDNLYNEPLHGGELFFYPQHCDHAVRWEGEVAFTLLMFRPQLFEQEFGCSSFADIFPFFDKYDRDIYTLVHLIIRGLKRDDQDLDYIDYLALPLAKRLVSLMGLKHKVIQEGQSPEKRIKEITDFIEAEIELGRKPTLGKLTRQAGFQSQSYFSKLFKKEMGIAPSKFVNQRAIEKAKYLLKKTDTNITKISQQCGFDSIRAFNETFKRVVGVTPSKFRAEFK